MKVEVKGMSDQAVSEFEFDLNSVKGELLEVEGSWSLSLGRVSVVIV